MKKKIIKTSSSILILSILTVCAQDISTNSVNAVNFSSKNTCSQELQIIINQLEVDNNLDEALLRDAQAYYEQCERTHTQHDYELFLAFKDPKDPKYIELLEKTMPAVQLNSNGDKKLEELPNGEFIEKFLRFYHPSSEYYKKLTSPQQSVIHALYERFKLPLTISRKDEL